MVTDRTLLVLAILGLIGCFIFSSFYTYYQYQAMCEYFPDLSFWDWIILHDKIRITP